MRRVAVPATQLLCWAVLQAETARGVVADGEACR